MPRLRYFIYCRKSQESEDRQVMSIESQISELKQKFDDDPNIQILDIYEESMSAKAPGRPIFNEMMYRIEKGEADGILAWHPDRLSRNSVDAGKIIYLLDLKIIKDLKFAAYTFIDTPEGKLMLSTILSFSKYYSDALSKNIKRGNKTKLEQGWLPSRAPLGYLNCKETNTIIADPDRFEMVQNIFELMKLDCYTPKMIYELAYHEWGLRSPLRKRMGGRPVSLSNIYRIISNPFYAGVITWKGELYDGKHEPMLTLEEFENIQKQLKRRELKSHTQAEALNFTYSGMMKCGECDCAITAENKKNRFGSHYVYYHCTHRKANYKCRQKSVEVKNLEQQITDFLQSITISDKVYDFLLTEAERHFNRSQTDSKSKVIAINRERDNIKTKIDNLNQMKINNLIPDNEYLNERQKLEFEDKKLAQNTQNQETRQMRFEPFKTYLEFRKQAVFWFKNGDAETKRLILKITGSNPCIIDRKLRIQAEKPFFKLPQNPSIPRMSGHLKEVRKWYGDCWNSSAIIYSIRQIQKRTNQSRSDS